MTKSQSSGATHGRTDGEAAPPRTMRAAVLDGPGPVTNLRVREVAVPQPPPGWVRVRVEAFGMNRSELHTRLGLAEGTTTSYTAPNGREITVEIVSVATYTGQ